MGNRARNPWFRISRALREGESGGRSAFKGESALKGGESTPFGRP
jgi:hypothetical protein